MKRVEIYLDDEQYDNLIIETRNTCKTISELIREAVDYKFGIINKIGFNEAVDTSSVFYSILTIDKILFNVL